MVRRIEALELLAPAVCDAGPGLHAGIAQLHEYPGESETDPVSLEKSLDVFHTKREARRVLSTMWNRVERLWEQAEAATRAVERGNVRASTRGG